MKIVILNGDSPLVKMQENTSVEVIYSMYIHFFLNNPFYFFLKKKKKN